MPTAPVRRSSNRVRCLRRTYDMVLEYAGGRIEVFADTVRCLPHSTTRHMDCFDGVTPGQAHVVTYEQGTIFTVDGETLRRPHRALLHPRGLRRGGTLDPGG
jgi:hypothetical protein